MTNISMDDLKEKTKAVKECFEKIVSWCSFVESADKSLLGEIQKAAEERLSIKITNPQDIRIILLHYFKCKLGLEDSIGNKEEQKLNYNLITDEDKSDEQVKACLKEVYDTLIKYKDKTLTERETEKGDKYRFMPPVYARTKWCGWQLCTDFKLIKDAPPKEVEFPSWVTGVKIVDWKYLRFDDVADDNKLDIRDFLFEGDKYDTGAHTEAKNTVFYLLLKQRETSDGQAHVTREFGRCNRSQFQIYIGASKDGVIKHWLDNPDSHCQAVNQLCKEIQDIQFLEYFDQFKGYQLVDVYLALAHLNTWQHALFVVSSHNTPQEMKVMQDILIKRHKTTSMSRELNAQGRTRGMNYLS